MPRPPRNPPLCHASQIRELWGIALSYPFTRRNGFSKLHGWRTDLFTLRGAGDSACRWAMITMARLVQVAVPDGQGRVDGRGPG